MARLQEKRVYWPLAILICLAALVLRLTGISFGYPLPIHPDEPKLVETALTILNTRDPNPHFFDYPSLNIYIQAFIFAFMKILKTIFMPRAEILPIHYYMAGRAFVSALSAATVLFTMETARRLFHPAAGLLAGTLLAVWPLHVANSYTATVDAPVAFWCVLATLASSFILMGSSRRLYYILSGVFVGLAISSKYTALIAAAPLLVSHVYAVRNKQGKLLDSNIILGLLAIPIAFLLTTPYAVLDPMPFIKALRFEAWHYRTGHPGAESNTWFSYDHYIRILWDEGRSAIPLFLSSLGLLITLRSDRVKALLVISTPLFLFLVVGSYKVFFARNIVAVLPYASIFAGTGTFLLWRRALRIMKAGNRQRWIAQGALLILLFAFSYSVGLNTVYAVTEIREATLPDTRWVCLNWITRNLPAGTSIGREHYTPPVEDFSDRFRAEYLGYYAVVRSPNQVNHVEYMIISSGDYGRFFADRERYQAEAEAYKSFMRKHELIHECAPQPGIMIGPTIQVYRLGENSSSAPSQQEVEANGL